MGIMEILLTLKHLNLHLRGNSQSDADVGAPEIRSIYALRSPYTLDRFSLLFAVAWLTSEIVSDPP